MCLEQGFPWCHSVNRQIVPGGQGARGDRCRGPEQGDRQSGRYDLLERSRGTGQAGPDQLSCRDQQGHPEPDPEDVPAKEQRAERDRGQPEADGGRHGRPEGRGANARRRIADHAGGRCGEGGTEGAEACAPGPARLSTQDHHEELGAEHGRQESGRDCDG